MVNARYYVMPCITYEGVTKSFRTGRLERELQMVQLSATRCSCIAILWVSLVIFDAITLFVASQRVIPKLSVYFVIDSDLKLLDTPSYIAFLVTDYQKHTQSNAMEHGAKCPSIAWVYTSFTKLLTALKLHLLFMMFICLCIHYIHIMWVPVTTAWCVLALRMEQTDSRYGGELWMYWISSCG
jgi:hypothetical protein